MQVQYTLTAAEWREARYLFNTRGQRGTGETWAWMLVAVPIIGSVGDLVHTARTSGITLRDSILPILLLLAAASMAALILAKRWRANRAGRLAGVIGLSWSLQVNENGLQRSRADQESDEPVAYAWDEFAEYRVGRKVLMLARTGGVGFEAVPLTAFDAEERERLQRLMARKIKAARPVEESRTGGPRR